MGYSPHGGKLFSPSQANETRKKAVIAAPSQKSWVGHLVRGLTLAGELSPHQIYEKLGIEGNNSRQHVLFFRGTVASWWLADITTHHKRHANRKGLSTGSDHPTGRAK